VQFGVDAGLIESAEGGTSADGLGTSGPPTRGAQVDLSGHPDLAPPLAAVAAYAALHCGGTSELLGLGTLVGKESNRLEVLATGLKAVGVDVEVRHDEQVCGLRISPPESERKLPSEQLLDPCGDHRMAFAFGLFGLLQPGILVKDPMTVSKSWPSFWEDLGAL
jgi:3-phosphoshikimate 1-carboxyvinyltransferase